MVVKYLKNHCQQKLSGIPQLEATLPTDEKVPDLNLGTDLLGMDLELDY
jgi:hypothetical protein